MLTRRPRLLTAQANLLGWLEQLDLRLDIGLEVDAGTPLEFARLHRQGGRDLCIQYRRRRRGIGNNRTLPGSDHDRGRIDRQPLIHQLHKGRVGARLFGQSQRAGLGQEGGNRTAGKPGIGGVSPVKQHDELVIVKTDIVTTHERHAGTSVRIWACRRLRARRCSTFTAVTGLSSATATCWTLSWPSVRSSSTSH